MNPLQTVAPTPHAGQGPPRRLHLEPSPKRLRILFNGQFVADSRNVMLLHEETHLPVYYIPQDDVRMAHLTPTDHSTHCPYKGDAAYWTVQVDDKRAENAVWGYPEPLPQAPDLTGYMAFYWNKMGAWFEEDEQVFGHARDPYHRIDVLHSSRHVRAEINGETVADTTRACLLFETGLPTRYYIPKTDVRLDWLAPSAKQTICAYKGEASYYAVRMGETLVKDIAWYYPYPNPEVAKIQNRICFLNEKVDLYVDGALQEKPQTPWS